MDGPQGIQSILTIVLLERLIDKGGRSGGLDTDTLLLLLLIGAAGQPYMVQPGASAGAQSTGSGWDTNNPLTLILLLQLLKRGTFQEASNKNKK